MVIRLVGMGKQCFDVVISNVILINNLLAIR